MRMIAGSRVTKLGSILIASCMAVIVYLCFFKHPPPDELLSMNRDSIGVGDFGAASFGGGSNNFGNQNKVGYDGEDDEVDESFDDARGLEEEEGDDNSLDVLFGDDDFEDDDGGYHEEKEEKLGLRADSEEEVKDEEQDIQIRRKVQSHPHFPHKDISNKDRHNNALKSRGDASKQNSDGETRKGNQPSESRKEKKVNKSPDNNNHSANTGRKSGGSSSSEVSGAEVWTKFLKKNNFVPIGVVFSKCDGPREQLGTVAMLQDKENGGVMSRTFMNITFEKEITGGQFYIEVLYNGKPLYDNYWELCELEEEVPEANRTFTCPIRSGHWIIDKPRHLPAYLPTGHYQSKAWAVDQDKKMIGCGYSDFKL